MQYGTKLGVAVAILMVCGMTSSARGQEIVGSGPQLFANQYTQGMSNQATAQMYVAPMPVPMWVGHTYYTYQPLYPHELMYRHTNRYHSYYDNGHGLNRTSVRYRTSPLNGLLKSISLPR